MFLKFVVFIVSFIVVGYSKSLELQKATIYHDNNISGWVMSEKLDGIRGYWDGKTMRSKGGYTIQTPKYFIKNFPPFALDGELWIQRGKFEKVQSIVLDSKPSKDWHQVTYNIFEVPYAEGNFTQRLYKAKNWFQNHPNKYVKTIEQIQCLGKSDLKSFQKSVEALGGEGVMIKNPKLSYFEGRSKQILKVKTFQDMEGEVLRINSGAGKYQNMMGSLTLKLNNGIIFRLGNGFKISERKNPSPIGSMVTFKYYGLTKNGKPKFASFIRIRDAKLIDNRVINIK